MADFSTTTKHAASDFNGGVQYGKNDQFSLDALNASIENGLYAANQVDNKTSITNSNGDIITSIKLSTLVRSGMGCQAPIGIDDSNNIYLNYTGALSLDYDSGALYVEAGALQGYGLYKGCNNNTLNVDLGYIGSNMVGEGLYFDSSSHKLSVDASNLSSSISSNLPNYSYKVSGNITAKSGYLTNIKAMHNGYITYNGSNWIELSMYVISSNSCKIWGFVQSSNAGTTGTYEYNSVTITGADSAYVSGEAIVTLDEIQTARTE